ncbi:MAG: U32 family peptidase [Anaerolineaceae bacterium]|nr:U32 family peptidase [Anaerolineaceae bacterium]
MERVELLAPAKDLESGMAAINCGADAVYIGAARFGARESAGNQLEDIASLVRYAHKYWAKVYVTVNTLLHDDELPQAERLINQLYDLGADALIIQDPGILEMELPPIPLFASTQMHNHTPERVAFLEKVGIRRAILARELSLEQIKDIRAKTSIELETFVHGALCVSYSGQCYLSYALGGRSGNRGQCEQHCRRAYRLVDANGRVLEEERYLLSLRDLNLSEHLDELLDAGVRSFKIEGRLKDKTYVMNVVAYYRKKLDVLLEERQLRASASGKVAFDFTPDPRKTFNRGYTTYFLQGRKKPVGSIDTPKATGEPLGRVTRIGHTTFILDGKTEIHRGDGLCYFNPQRELVGTAVNDVQGQMITPERMPGLTMGTLVFRNHDHAFFSAIEKSKSERKIAIRFRLAASLKGLAIFVQDEDGNEAMHTLEIEKIPAEKPEQALETIEKQLRKLGGTEYECTFVRIDLPEAYFIPMAVLNALRRSVLEELTRLREENYPRIEGGAVINTSPFPTQELGFQGNVLNQKAEAFYRRHGVRKIEPAAESGLDMHGRKVMTTRHCIKHQLGWCPKENPDLRLAEPLALVDEQNNVFQLRFRCKECEMEVYYSDSDE